MDKKMEDALNKQMNAEFYSSYLYLSMAAWFESQNLGGFARWLELQAQEEWGHGMKFYRFINERMGTIKLDKIDKPAEEWESPLAVFKEVMKHEQKVTGMINDLVDLAAELKDHASFNFLQWFVAEQVEEEASADEVLNKLKMAKAAPAGLYMLNKEMGARE